MKRRIQPDKWSAFEQIAHLTAYQPIFLRRLQLIVQESNPVFERYVAEQDPIFNECLQSELKVLLAALSDQRAVILYHLQQMPEAELKRTGRHPKYGLLDIAAWTQFFLLHEAHHLYNLFMLTRDLRSQQPQKH